MCGKRIEMYQSTVGWLLDGCRREEDVRPCQKDRTSLLISVRSPWRTWAGTVCLETISYVPCSSSSSSSSSFFFWVEEPYSWSVVFLFSYLYESVSSCRRGNHLLFCAVHRAQSLPNGRRVWRSFQRARRPFLSCAVVFGQVGWKSTESIGI